MNERTTGDGWKERLKTNNKVLLGTFAKRTTGLVEVSDQVKSIFFTE